jgi:hypothetical protein
MSFADIPRDRVTNVCQQAAKFRGRVLETLCYKTLLGSEI